MLTSCCVCAHVQAYHTLYLRPMGVMYAVQLGNKIACTAACYVCIKAWQSDSMHCGVACTDQAVNLKLVETRAGKENPVKFWKLGMKAVSIHTAPQTKPQSLAPGIQACTPCNIRMPCTCCQMVSDCTRLHGITLMHHAMRNVCCRVPDQHWHWLCDQTCRVFPMKTATPCTVI